MKAYLAVLFVLGLQTSPLPAADKREAPKPLPPEIVKAWRAAGAGSMKSEREISRARSSRGFSRITCLPRRIGAE